MDNLGGEMGNLNGEMEESVTDTNQKDTKMKMDNKPDDLDGLQMLRLAQEDKTLLKKDMLPGLEKSIDQQTPIEGPTLISSTLELTKGDKFKHKEKCFQFAKPIVMQTHLNHDDTALEEPMADADRKPEIQIATKHDMAIKRSEKQKGVDGASVERKPALVKKAVSELHNLSERQQKILQDFHVKFVLEGVNVDEDDKARSRKHSEFVELKKRLEEEEKMYAGCALAEASDIELTDKDQIDAETSTTITPKKLTSTDVLADGTYSLEPEDIVVRATMDDVIDSLAEVMICNSDASSGDGFTPLPRTQNVRNSLKNMADDDGLSELQQYTYREGSGGCTCCCRKAGKQIDEGDESDVYMTNSSYLVFNVVCPVSGIPVVDLEDPVRSEGCEHIYDRTSALNYIATMEKDGFCLCATTGCRALLAENKLVADSRLWQDIEELRQIKAALWESRMLQDFVNIGDSDDD